MADADASTLSPPSLSLSLPCTVTEPVVLAEHVADVAALYAPKPPPVPQSKAY